MSQDRSPSASPAERLVQAVYDVHPGEFGPAVSFFVLYFAAIAIFWCLKPLRTSGVVKAFGPEWYPLFKQGTALIMPLAVWGFSALADRLRRDRLYLTLLAGFAALNLGFWLCFVLGGGDGAAVGFFFYVDVYITVGIAMFYTYLNDTHSPEQATRLYGPIGIGGMIGGMAGTAASGWLSETLGNHLLLVPLPIFALAAWMVLRLNRQLGEPDAPRPRPKEANGGTHAALAGARLVLKSPYLLAIVGIVGLYELASTNLDYIFTTLSDRAFADRDAMAAFQGKVFFAATLGGTLVQTFAVSWVHRRFGVRAGLLVLPAVLLLGTTGFLVLPALLVISFSLASEGMLHYSINQTSKEMLYTPTDRDTKYKAKAFIDMFVMRAAKGVSAVLLLGFGFLLLNRGYDLRWLAAFTMLLLVGWIGCVRVAARHFEQMTQPREAPTPAVTR